MICDKCHRPLNSTVRVCPYCGEIVRSKDASRAQNSSHIHDHENKNLKTFIKISLVVILLIGAGIAAAYYAYSYFIGNSTKEYAGSISKINVQINSANDGMAEILRKDDNDFPVSDIISKIPETKKSLDKAAENLGNISAPSKYSASHNKLKQALELNNMIYTQLEDVLSSPASSDIQKNEEQLYKYIEQCSDTYSSVKIENSSFALPEDITSISSKLGPWVQHQQNKYAKVSELMSSFSKYFEEISKTLLNYENSKVDITQALKKSRFDKTSWDELLSLIAKNEKSIGDIKASYIKIHAPSELRNFNNRFSSILDSSLDYYSKLKQAVVTDMNFDEEEEPDAEQVDKKINEIDAMYEEAEKMNSSITSDYRKFTQDIESEKSKYMNPEYIEKIMEKQ